MIKSKLITKIFQRYIDNKDIRFFKNKKSYYLIFRILRNFLLSDIILKIYNFRVFGSIKRSKNSHYLLKKCEFSDNHELETIKKISDKKRVLFIDCGCNYGFYSFYVASLSSKNIIYSIEASKITSNEFLKNLSLNNFTNIKFFNNAVSNVDGKLISFNESINDWESSSVQTNFKVQSVETIKSFKIDTLIKDVILENYITIIKLDVEGDEFNALQGALAIIKKTSPLIIMEFSKYIFNDKVKIEFFQKFLRDFEYSIYDTNHNKKNLDEVINKIEKLKKKHNTIGNYYLLKNSIKNFNILFNE